MPLHRDGGQLQTGDPAFGAGFQGGNIFRREIQPHHSVKKLGGFSRRKPQDRQHAVRSAGPGRGSRASGRIWVFAGGDNQVHLRRLVFEQKGKGLVDWLENRSDGNHPAPGRNVRNGGDVIEQGCQNCFSRRGLRRLKHSQHTCTNRPAQASAMPRPGRSESVRFRHPLRPVKARPPAGRRLRSIH